MCRELWGVVVAAAMLVGIVAYVNVDVECGNILPGHQACLILFK